MTCTRSKNRSRELSLFLKPNQLSVLNSAMLCSVVNLLLQTRNLLNRIVTSLRKHITKPPVE